MNYNPLKISLQTICIALFLLSLSIALVILFTPLYSLAVDWFSIDQQTGFSKTILSENYQVLINYLVNPFESNLQMPNFPSSINGLIHFKDVKQLFLFDLASVPLLGILSWKIWRQIKKQASYWYYIKPFRWMIITPFIVVVIGSMMFQDAFLLFHKLIFTNSTWIFNPKYDPIILALPEEYFMLCFVAVLGLFMLIAISLELIVKHRAKLNK